MSFKLNVMKIPCSFAYKVVCIDNRFTNPTIIYRGENTAYEFFKAILEECKCCKKKYWKNISLKF